MNKIRCSWVSDDPVYVDYHDHEWGVAVYDDHKLYEMFLLETFQAGLSWITILRKRKAFAEAFDHFDVTKIAQYDETKISALMNYPGIIHNRRKILSAVKNARIFISIQQEFGSFCEYIWRFTDHQIIFLNDREPVTCNEISDLVSRDLKQRGMSFVGSVTMYSYLEAIGVFNNHQSQCFLHQK